MQVLAAAAPATSGGGSPRGGATDPASSGGGVGHRSQPRGVVLDDMRMEVVEPMGRDRQGGPDREQDRERERANQHKQGQHLRVERGGGVVGDGGPLQSRQQQHQEPALPQDMLAEVSKMDLDPHTGLDVYAAFWKDTELLKWITGEWQACRV